MKLWSTNNPAGRTCSHDRLKRRIAQEIADIVLALSQSPNGHPIAGILNADRETPERLAELIVDALSASDGGSGQLTHDLIVHMKRHLEATTDFSLAASERPD